MASGLYRDDPSNCGEMSGLVLIHVKSNPMNLAELKRAYKRSLIDNEASGSPNYGGRRFILAKEAGSKLGVSCQP